MLEAIIEMFENIFANFNLDAVAAVFEEIKNAIAKIFGSESAE